MLEALFPSGVVAVEAGAAGLWEAALDPAEEQCIAGAAAARVREFAAGRACARRALAGLGLPEAPLLRAPDRAPCWPSEAVGSITHCRDFCAAVVAPRAAFRALGVDAERSGRVTPRILERVTREREREALARFARAAEADDPATLLWCAKESVLKCLSAATGRLPGPREVEIQFEAVGFSARPVSDALRGAGTPVLHGRTAIRESLVLAGTCLAAGAVP